MVRIQDQESTTRVTLLPRQPIQPTQRDKTNTEPRNELAEKVTDNPTEKVIEKPKDDPTGNVTDDPTEKVIETHAEKGKAGVTNRGWKIVTKKESENARSALKSLKFVLKFQYCTLNF